MATFTVPDNVVTITEKDFWSSLRVPRGCARPDLLRGAIRLGLAGRRDAAYGALAAYHREALADEWARVRSAAASGPAPAEGVLRDLLRRKVTAWHTQVIQFGREIDWIPASLAHDSVHGFNYLHWLRPAVTAFIRTGEPRYRAFLIDILTQRAQALHRPEWKDQMPWLTFSALQVHAKWAVMWPSYLALIHSGEVPTETAEGLLKLFLGFGRATAAAFKAYVPANNAFCAANTDFLHLALVLPEFRESAAWRRKATGFLREHARRGFYADGGNRERVWGYGVMHLQALTDGYRTAARHGGLGRADAEILGAIRRGAAWYVQSITPEPWNAFPTYGDAGWSKGDRLESIARLVEGIPGVADPRTDPRRARSALLGSSGFAILRNGSDARSTYANLNVGEFGGWHSHWDLLSMNVWAHGEPLLEELCRFGPYGTPLDVLFRAPESHNQVLIDGMVYDNQRVKGEDVAWHSDARIDYVSAYHRAYRYYCFGQKDDRGITPNIEAVVRRTIVLVKDPGYLVVMDAVSNLNSPSFTRAVSQHWHSPAPFRVAGPGVVRVEGRAGCLLAFAHPEGLQRFDTGVDFTAQEASHLGYAYDRYSLRVRRWMPLDYRGNVGFLTVIYPFRGRAPALRVRALAVRGGAWWQADAVEVTGPSGRDVIALNPERRKGVALGRQPVRGRAWIRLGRGRGAVSVA